MYIEYISIPLDPANRLAMYAAHHVQLIPVI